MRPIVRVLLVAPRIDTLRVQAWREAAVSLDLAVEVFARPDVRSVAAALVAARGDVCVAVDMPRAALLALAPLRGTGAGLGLVAELAGQVGALAGQTVGDAPRAGLRAVAGVLPGLAAVIWDVPEGEAAPRPRSAPGGALASLGAEVFSRARQRLDGLGAAALADQLVTRAAADHAALRAAGVPTYALARVDAGVDPTVFTRREKERPIGKGQSAAVRWVLDDAKAIEAARAAWPTIAASPLRAAHAWWAPSAHRDALAAAVAALGAPAAADDAAIRATLTLAEGLDDSAARAAWLRDAHLVVTSSRRTLLEAAAVGAPALFVGRDAPTPDVERVDAGGLGAAVVHWAGDAKRRAALAERTSRVDAEWGRAAEVRRLGVVLEAVARGAAGE
jgi:hypothetical protein